MNNRFKNKIEDKRLAEELRKEIYQLADEISDLMDEMPERAEDFANSILDKSLGIINFIEDHDKVTLSQLEALTNMKAGLEKWLN